MARHFTNSLPWLEHSVHHKLRFSLIFLIAGESRSYAWLWWKRLFPGIDFICCRIICINNQICNINWLARVQLGDRENSPSTPQLFNLHPHTLKQPNWLDGGGFVQTWRRNSGANRLGLGFVGILSRLWTLRLGLERSELLKVACQRLTFSRASLEETMLKGGEKANMTLLLPCSRNRVCKSPISLLTWMLGTRRVPAIWREGCPLIEQR